MTVIHAKTALLPAGWANDVRIEIVDSRIAAVTAGASPEGQGVDCLLPAMVNLHSHAFQRAMAGMTEYRSAGQDSFWTWRTLMYRFLDRLSQQGTGPRYARPLCTGPVASKGQGELQKDIANLKSAMAAHGVQRGFMNAASPGVISLFLQNAHYPTREAYLQAGGYRRDFYFGQDWDLWYRLAQQGPDQHLAAARLQHAGGAPLVEALGQQLPACGHAAIAQVRKTGGHQAGGFAAGVGVDHGDAFHGRATSVQVSERQSGPGRGVAA